MNNENPVSSDDFRIRSEALDQANKLWQSLGGTSEGGTDVVGTAQAFYDFLRGVEPESSQAKTAGPYRSKPTSDDDVVLAFLNEAAERTRRLLQIVEEIATQKRAASQ